VICFIFAVIIVGIIAYSYYYGQPGRDYPIHSASKIFTGADSVSTGLSRSFSAIVRLNFDSARAFNPHGTRIFLFFFIQLFMRLSGLFLMPLFTPIQRSRIITADIIISIVLFVVFFLPLVHHHFVFTR
jgi:hypothetical protein